MTLIELLTAPAPTPMSEWKPLNKPIPAKPKKVKLKPVPPRTEGKSRCVASFERCRDKPCSVEGCNNPRHISKSGGCWTNLCTKHYQVRQGRTVKRRKGLL